MGPGMFDGLGKAVVFVSLGAFFAGAALFFTLGFLLGRLTGG